MKTFVFSDPQKSGDWIIVRAEDETTARKALTRAQKRRYTSVRLSLPTREHDRALGAA